MRRHRPIIALLLTGLATTTLPAAAQRTAAATEPPLTSYQLIGRAEKAERISTETAHKYRIFAAFGDSRLPEEYRGAVSGGEPPTEVARVRSLLGTLSLQTQAELAPFFMRPDEPGSWITLGTVAEQELEPGGPRPPGRGLGWSQRTPARVAASLYQGAFSRAPGWVVSSLASARVTPSTVPVTWRTFTAVGGKVKVWAQDRYPGDAAKAEALATEMDARIWSKLTGLMARSPDSDANLPRNGGGGALDIYLVHAPTQIDPASRIRKMLWDGVAESSVPANNCHSSRYLLINSRLPLVGNRTTSGLYATAAHELFHAIQFVIAAKDACAAPWIRESTATWAENWLYRTENGEHAYAKAYLAIPHKPIDNSEEGLHHYGAYLLPLYREKTGGTPDFIRDMWENFERSGGMPSAPTPSNFDFTQRIRAQAKADRLRILKGVNDVLDGGFDKTWPRFLVKNWNRPPTDAPDGHKSWDNLTEVAAVSEIQTFDTRSGPVTKDIGFPAEDYDGRRVRGIAPLSGVFTRHTFEPSVRSIVFVNTIAEIAHRHSSVWGIQKIRGRWKDPEDWSKDFEKAWCRDDQREDLEELILVFGNSDSKDLEPVEVTKLPEIKASPTGCTAWVGTSTAETTITSSDPNMTIVETADATMRFEVDSAQMLPGQPREYWKITSGQITWTVTVTGACTGGANGVQAITDLGPGEEMATLRVWEENGTLLYMGTNGPWPGPGRTYRVTCPNQPPFDMPLLMALGWWTTDAQNYKVTQNGKVITSTITTRQPGTGSGGSVTHKMSYSLRLSP